MTMLTGGCFCGRVRYETDGTPFHATICHCADCRRIVGAHLVAWFSVKRASLQWIGTPPASFKSSRPVVRRFCANCSTSLTFEDEAYPDELDLTIASLDDPASIAPQDHVWADSRPAWDLICDGLPAHGRTRSE